nr:hypothetical protein [Candidatus Njordarchaeota archaeon]
MKIVEISVNVPDRLVELMRKAYHLIPVNRRLLVCPNSMWDKLKNTVKQLAQDVTEKYERVFLERSMILVKDIVKGAEIIADDKVKVKLDRNNEVTGRLVLSGGVCPFCGESKLTFVSLDKDKDRLTVCLSCKRRMVIINSDSIQNFDRLFPEIYKIV